MERLETQALNWAAVNKLWQEERVLNGGQHGYHAGCHPGSSFVSRRSNSLMAPQRAPERWKGVNLVRLPGWSRPKTVTFVLGLRSSTSPSSKESSYELSPGEGKGKDMVDYAHHLREDWTDVSESVDSREREKRTGREERNARAATHLQKLPLWQSDAQAPDDAQGPGEPGNAAAPAEPGLRDLARMLEILGQQQQDLLRCQAHFESYMAGKLDLAVSQHFAADTSGRAQSSAEQQRRIFQRKTTEEDISLLS